MIDPPHQKTAHHATHENVVPKSIPIIGSAILFVGVVVDYYCDQERDYESTLNNDDDEMNSQFYERKKIGGGQQRSCTPAFGARAECPVLFATHSVCMGASPNKI